MHDNLAESFEARRPLLEYVAHALEQEVKEYVSGQRGVHRVVFRVASVRSFLQSARGTLESNICRDPLVEIENQIIGRVAVQSAENLVETEKLIRNSFSAVQHAWLETMESNDATHPRRSLTCLIPPQVRPPGWDARVDVPKTFQIQIVVAPSNLNNHHDDAETHSAPPHGEVIRFHAQPNMPREPTAGTNPRRPPVELAALGATNSSSFDVFLAHSSEDKALIKSLADELTKEGLRPWLDSEQIRPGELFQDMLQQAIKNVRSFAVCIGTRGIGRWQSIELKAAVSQCINRGIPVIPVLLPGVQAIPSDLPFLGEFNGVRFLASVAERESILLLVWGITGERRKADNDRSVAVDTRLMAESRSTQPGRSGRVLFALHGIRTHAGWNRALYEVASKDAWQVRTDRWNFGYFSVLQFLLPWARSAKVRWFRHAYREEIQDRSVLLDEGQHPSIVAHSFGTYILGNALLKYDWLRFNVVILCGSILPVEFPWDKLIERGQVQAVRNEFGLRDIWSRIVHWFVAGTGPSGQKGYQCKSERLDQVQFEYTHSEFFDKGHMEAKWLPFLNRHKNQIPPTEVAVQRPRANRPWAMYAMYSMLLLFTALIIWSLLPIDESTTNENLNVENPVELARQAHQAAIDARKRIVSLIQSLEAQFFGGEELTTFERIEPREIGQAYQKAFDEGWRQILAPLGDSDDLGRRLRDYQSAVIKADQLRDPDFRFFPDTKHLALEIDNRTLGLEVDTDGAIRVPRWQDTEILRKVVLRSMVAASRISTALSRFAHTEVTDVYRFRADAILDQLKENDLNAADGSRLIHMLHRCMTILATYKRVAQEVVEATDEPIVQLEDVLR